MLKFRRLAPRSATCSISRCEACRCPKAHGPWLRSNPRDRPSNIRSRRSCLRKATCRPRTTVALDRFGTGSILSGAILCPTIHVAAQTTIVWSDINCSDSRIVVPGGLKCRATQEFAGTNSRAGGVGGVFRNWSAYGSLPGAKVYFLIYEAVGRGSSQTPTTTLQESAVSLSPEGRNARSFSSSSAVAGGDYLTFTSAKGDACLGIRKFGPAEGRGYKWILYATRCVPAGGSVTEADAIRFLTETGYRT